MKILMLIFFIILGLVFGSFFACMGYRIPNKVASKNKRSFCPKCKKQLKWYMNIPVFSYIFLKGKCAYCKKKISPIYLIVELLSVFLFTFGYLTYLNIDSPNYLYFGIYIILCSALLITFVTDFLYFYVSDRVILISLFLILIVKLTFLDFAEIFYSIISGLIIFALMYLVRIIGNRLFNKESLGGGDIKLSGIIGCALGVIPGFISIFIASVLGLIFALISKKDDKTGIVPFGPFLLIGSIVCLYFYDKVELIVDYLLKVL